VRKICINHSRKLLRLNRPPLLFRATCNASESQILSMHIALLDKCTRLLIHLNGMSRSIFLHRMQPTHCKSLQLLTYPIFNPSLCNREEQSRNGLAIFHAKLQVLFKRNKRLVVWQYVSTRTCMAILISQLKTCAELSIGGNDC